jgi:preprotein translocase subunit SecD
MKDIRYRMIVIGALALLSILQLLPKQQKQRVVDTETGRMKDTSVRRVPINLGLDLQGGIHLALEVDQSKGPVADCSDAIRRAERVVRTRVDEFGTTEPVVQVVGQCRLVVELAGEKDPGRAKQIVQKTAFLEFRITDMKNLFRDALPGIDAELRKAGVRGGQPGAVSAVSQLFAQDSTKRGTADTAANVNAPGALSALLFQGQLPGEYLVPVEQLAYAEIILARPEV